jgi:uncharacterized protein YndB with AHSA1/START domain
MNAQNPVIYGEVTVNAPIDKVWETWTTEEGIKTFFAPACRVWLKPEGAFEMYFDLHAPLGEQGSEGCHILAFQSPQMLTFTWNAPTHLPEVRNHRTVVTLRFREPEPGKTTVMLWHSGWGEGDTWDAAFNYFARAWLEVVFPRLQQRFEKGPVDWDRI